MSLLFPPINTGKNRMSPLYLLLLVLLSTSPKYGYEMLKTIKEEFEGIWDLKTGTLYPALKSLEKQGLIKTQRNDGVDFYNITESGKQFLQMLSFPQQNFLKFGIRFTEAIAKWMSPELKIAILSNMVKMSQDEISLNQILIKLLGENVPKDMKLSILRNMKQNMQKRSEDVSKFIEKLEAEP
jgi:DNA-binding PadR family transcriptional regulator